ncbi:ArsR/SmtB family transcription factor [Paenibacillus turpanensis]|uniref:ArsR/SmtB family transcription factor n=1 Tax=Paenibacillus turpanensis TaxID=2689078 RepID=UPI00140ACAAE|nr:metalloregulator ArsR/SmtB family transcription factor [Paenibacillus turpanensis]
MSDEFLDLKVKLLKGLSDKTRLQIVQCVRDREKTVSEIVGELKGNQSNISQHLACLKGCGIVAGRQVGKYTYYSIRHEQIRVLLQQVDEVLSFIHAEVRDCEKTEWCLNLKEEGELKNGRAGA